MNNLKICFYISILCSGFVAQLNSEEFKNVTTVKSAKADLQFLNPVSENQLQKLDLGLSSIERVQSKAFSESTEERKLKKKRHRRKKRPKHHRLHRKHTKFLLPLLIAYKLKFFALIPISIAAMILLSGSAGLAGFFFALFSAVLSVKQYKY